MQGTSKPDADDPYAEIKASREKVITLGGSSINEFTERAVDSFNHAQDKYWVDIEEYNLVNLQIDVMRKQGPDIIYMDGLNADVLARKGVVEDLTPYRE